MTTITISAGGKTGSYRGEAGVFAGTLVSHSIEGPFKSKQPGKENETFMLNEWGFAIEDAPEDANMVWITSGEASGPKSKTFGILTALFGGKAPPAGLELDVEKQLFGRMALVDVRENDRGYMDAVAVTPLPKAMQKGAAPQASSPRTAAPVAVADANPDDLPF